MIQEAYTARGRLIHRADRAEPSKTACGRSAERTAPVKARAPFDLCLTCWTSRQQYNQARRFTLNLLKRGHAA